ncbi:MAG: dihydrofolate reductase [Bacteroidales bacterium]|nr:dihydrofolate reductase [Bacteroidales bacterium]MDD4604175.1 dihydrofolate reductase [Bacteroidales bacterium]
MISIIVAIAENRAIGKNNDLLWHIPADMKRFKGITSGHPIIMGKRTFYSLPRRPLPNRRNIVITDVPGEQIPGCDMAYSIQETIALCNPHEENFIIGGASIYQQFLPYTNRLYLTMVHKSFEGDVFFPEIDFSQWKLFSKENFEPSEGVDFSYSFEIYNRITSF